MTQPDNLTDPAARYQVLVALLQQAGDLVAIVVAALRRDADILCPDLIPFGMTVDRGIRDLIEALRAPWLGAPIAACPGCRDRLTIGGVDAEREAWRASCLRCGARALVTQRGNVLEHARILQPRPSGTESAGQRAGGD